MKTKLYILLFFVSFGVYSQILRSKEKEHFIANAHFDWAKGNNNYGLDYVIEAGYSGVIDAVLGIEHFPALYGGYFDVHGAIGKTFVSGNRDQLEWSGGLRLMVVWRDAGWRAQEGFEAKFMYAITDDLSGGLRATLDNRRDMEIYNWSRIWVGSAFITFQYKIKLLKG